MSQFMLHLKHNFLSTEMASLNNNLFKLVFNITVHFTITDGVMSREVKDNISATISRKVHTEDST